MVDVLRGWVVRLGGTVLLGVLLLAGCGGGAAEEEAPVAAEPTVVEDAALGMAVVIPPGSPFEPVGAGSGEIRLRFPETSEFSEGTAIFAAEEKQFFGVNLVEAVNERKAEIEGRPQGEFLGQVELGTEILGTAFSTRGRFVDEGGQEVEEIRIFAVHPSGDRLLHMTYRYSPSGGQAQARMMDQAFVAFGYLEPLVAQGDETSDAETSDETPDADTPEADPAP